MKWAQRWSVNEDGEMVMDDHGSWVENAYYEYLKAEIERCFELVKAVKNERKSAVFKEGVWYVPVEELKQKEADCLVLKAEVARLRASSFVTAVPVEQYERLVKAGDAMADALNLDDDVFDNHEKKEAQAKWNAAKEGKPSV